MSKDTANLCAGFLMNPQQIQSIRKAFLEIHFDQVACSYLSRKQIEAFATDPNHTLGAIGYNTLLLHVGEPPSPFLYLLFDQVRRGSTAAGVLRCQLTSGLYRSWRLCW